MAEKTLQQQAYDVGYGRVTSRQKARATNAIVNAANGMAGLAYDISKTVIGIQEEAEKAEKAKQAEEDSYNSDADIYYDTIINSINQASDNFESQGVNTNVYQSNMYDLVDTVLDEQWIVDNIGGSNDHASRFLTEYGDEIRMKVNGLVTTTTTNIQRNLVVANDINKRNSLIGLAGSPEEALAGAQENYERNNVGMYDLGENRDPSKPGVQAEIGYQWTISHINEEAEKAIHMESENDFKSRMRNSYTSFTDGKYSEDDIETANAVKIYADSVDEEAGRAYQTALKNAISNAESKATVYSNLELSFKRENGNESPTPDQAYSMMAEAGFDPTNQYDMAEATKILANLGVTEDLMLDDKARQAFSSVVDSDFYDIDNQGFGIYENGTLVDYTEGDDSVRLSLQSQVNGDVQRTNMQPLIDRKAGEFGIEKGSKSYELIAEAIILKETALMGDTLEYNKSQAWNAYYSDMSDDDLLTHLSSMKIEGAIDGEFYNEIVNKIDQRNNIYTQAVNTTRDLIKNSISWQTSELGDGFSTQYRNQLNSFLLDGPGANERLETMIRSASGSDPTKVRSLTQGEVDKYVEDSLNVIANEAFANDIWKGLAGPISAMGGESTLSMPEGLLKNENAYNLYVRYQNGEFGAFIDDKGLTDARLYLDNRENWNGGLNLDSVFDTVAESIYGKKYNEIENVGQRNIVELNASMAIVESAQVNDIYKALFGSGEASTDSSLLYKYSKDALDYAPKVKEVNIEGVGKGLMDSSGYVYAIDPSSYGSGKVRIMTWRFATNSEEYKTTWGSEENISLNTLGKDYVIEGALTKKGFWGNSTNYVSQGLMKNVIFLQKIIDLRTGGTTNAYKQ